MKKDAYSVWVNGYRSMGTYDSPTAAIFGFMKKENVSKKAWDEGCAKGRYVVKKV